MTACFHGPRSRLIAALLLSFLMLVRAPSARAEVQDIAAASRSVVRVALVATDGDNAYFVGHGSGVVVAPGRVLTNAHVVELTRSEPNIVIGIIPPQGKKSFGGKVIAYSPGNDLALIAVDGASLPVATFFTGSPQDGDQVTAIGYPGSVDRAQGMSLEDIIRPMAPVRTSGTVSGGRASKQFDTVLHTAPLASGNSGGPLVDQCGRVVGLNSFGSLSEGSDAEYGFAVSNREIASFLRQAGIQAARSSEACRSMDEIEAAQEIADERARAAAAKRASDAEMARREQVIAARAQAQQDVIARRENMMALSALLLALAVAAGGMAMLGQSKGDLTRTRRFGAAAGFLTLAAIAVFLLRPGFGSPNDAEGGATNEAAGPDNMAEAAPAASGDRLCRLDTSLSRVTVSETQDMSFNWRADGCVNGQTQYVRAQEQWVRILVPSDDAAISVRRFDPSIGRYRTDQYLVDAETLENARTMRDGLARSGCTTDPQKLAELAAAQADIQALLPAQPNERLVYQCQAATRGAP
ncbi:peptidase S1B family protein [Sphingobium sp. SYK-6]|uniref:S1C family serine protease n=1 Tax=Sphingobium sp. (strain NBRC 103272 / SYK-6) TaxID=627192 RepID=UPI0002277E3E|nr:serine protease [Sphingobium sp. SYK-6]BAK68406.1 peptidase S1B family protein [Sphingobium sp. SYK-6]